MKSLIKYYIISDTHFLHSNIIKYEKRPFKNLEEMDKKLIKRWNACVNDGDVVIHLGDFALNRGSSEKVKTIIKQLKGNIILIKGNHDRKTMSFYINAGINFVCERFNWYYCKKKILFLHSPHKIEYGDLKNDIIFHGHSHSKGKKIKKKGKCILVNLSVENINYKPVEIASLIDKIKNETKTN